MKKLLPVAISLLLVLPALSAVEPDIDYMRDVKPILQGRCYSCHGAVKKRAGLRLDTGALIRKGGDNGSAVMAGDVAKSLLVKRVTATDKNERMPPKGKPLTQQQIERIKTWIVQGAKSPNNERPDEDPRKHWAFQKPVRPPVPRVKNTAWVRNPIDAFLAAEHEKRGLKPSPPANNAILLRRVYLDLIGLPPTRQELHAFLREAEAKPQAAYEKVVERLLNSPQYGERWGRHWMDVWRYSDWYGRRRVPDVLNSYGQIWRWRDWIVRSLNEDKGYDRMVMEMLAADEIAPTDDKNLVATGFIVRNFYRWNYNTWMADTVEHTGKAFLGLTLNCCHCHDHKYDPIANEEYFRFRAFFEPIEIRHDRVPGEPDPGKYPRYSYGAAYKPITSGMVRIVDDKLQAKTFMYSGGEARNVIKGEPPVIPGAPAILGGDRLRIEPVELPPEAWYPGLKPFVQREEIAKRKPAVAQAQTTLQKAKQLVGGANKRLADSKSKAAIAKARADLRAAELTLRVDEINLARAHAELSAIQARVNADNIRYKGEPGDPIKAAHAASKAERQAKFETARLELARAERALASAGRKNAKNAKAKAALKKATQRLQKAKAAAGKAKQQLGSNSDKYTPLGPQYPKRSTGRRTALAQWIASRANPVTARLAINHIWLRHFGRAIVKTTDNFGRSGTRPTHPKLLDWLAVELMENGWRMKHIHRLIVTSKAYRQRSGVRGQGSEVRGQVQSPPTAVGGSQTLDRDNIYLWRFNPSRMEAEVLRDSVLHVAGTLDTTIGGKDIDQKLGLTNPRRSIYFTHHGEGRMQFLDLFDAADPCDCYRRTTSVRPQQALAMANSELTIRQARLLARRLDKEIGRRNSDNQFIIAGFEQILTRQPTAAEQKASIAFLQKQVKLFRSAKPGELAGGPKKQPTPPSTEPVLRARENFIQALFNHHDFVTIR